MVNKSICALQSILPRSLCGRILLTSSLPHSATHKSQNLVQHRHSPSKEIPNPFPPTWTGRRPVKIRRFTEAQHWRFRSHFY